jgi:signal recognition particle GTPase
MNSAPTMDRDARGGAALSIRQIIESTQTR